MLLGLCLIAAMIAGISRITRANASGWRGSGRHRWFISAVNGERVKGLYKIDRALYYFGNDGFMRIGWIKEDGYVGYANQDGKIARGEAEVNGKSYYFQPETGQLYTGWMVLDGVQYCFDETGHPRTGMYQENDVTWQLDANGAVKSRLSGWKKTNGVLEYYNEDGSPAQGLIQIDDKDYYFVDGISQAGWVDTEAGRRYLDGNGNLMTGWCVIDGQAYAFDANGALKQGWDHSHGRSYYFEKGISQAGVYQEGQISQKLNGSGSVEAAIDTVPKEELTDAEEGEPPTQEELLEELSQQLEETQPEMEQDSKEEISIVAEPEVPELEAAPAEEIEPAQNE